MIAVLTDMARARPWLVASLAIAAAAAATLAGALFFEHVIGLAPCPLCLEQRQPYYAVIPLALATALAASLRWPACVPRVGLILAGLLMVWAMWLGVYHAGAEWGFWPGPTACAAPASVPTSPAELMRQLRLGAPVVDCTVAAWRFLGLSLAGWNVVIAACLFAVAMAAASRSAETVPTPALEKSPG